ncbi:RNA methyltransferase substrate-binding domain-containing protein, partial [Bacteroidota bacterium]
MEDRNNPASIAFGIHPVIEAIESGKEIEKVFLKKGANSEAINGKMSVAKADAESRPVVLLIHSFPNRYMKNTAVIPANTKG